MTECAIFSVLDFVIFYGRTLISAQWPPTVSIDCRVQLTVSIFGNINACKSVGYFLIQSQ